MKLISLTRDRVQVLQVPLTTYYGPGHHSHLKLRAAGRINRSPIPALQCLVECTGNGYQCVTFVNPVASHCLRILESRDVRRLEDYPVENRFYKCAGRHNYKFVESLKRVHRVIEWRMLIPPVKSKVYDRRTTSWKLRDRLCRGHPKDVSSEWTS